MANSRVGRWAARPRVTAARRPIRLRTTRSIARPYTVDPNRFPRNLVSATAALRSSGSTPANERLVAVALVRARHITMTRALVDARRIRPLHDGAGIGPTASAAGPKPRRPTVPHDSRRCRPVRGRSPAARAWCSRWQRCHKRGRAVNDDRRLRWLGQADPPCEPGGRRVAGGVRRFLHHRLAGTPEASLIMSSAPRLC